MKILEPDSHSNADYLAALGRNVTTAWRPLGGEVESLIIDYNGPPAHIFWNYVNGIDTPFAVPYGTMWERRDIAIRVFGLTSPVRFLSAITKPYSHIWRLVEDTGGSAMVLPIATANGLRAAIEEFHPQIIHAPLITLTRLMNFGVEIPSIERIVVAGGCHPIAAGAMEAVAQFYGVPVISLLHLPWIGIVAHSDGTTFAENYVGRLISKVWIKFSEGGLLDIASDLSEDVRIIEDGKWKRMGKDYFRTALKGYVENGDLYITENTGGAGVPQRLPR